jgi:ATP-dependent Clp protease protease subunit
MTTWFKFTNLATAEKPTAGYAITIHEAIGAFGKPASTFMAELNNVPLDADINLSIHSPGGNLLDGLAMYHALLPRSNNITATVEGVAASAASLVLQAAGKRVMPENAWIMIHNTQGGAYGESKDLREVADLMDRFTGSIKAIYSARTGKSTEEAAAWMNKTTWMNGAEALSNGFVDETIAPLALAAKFDERSFELSIPDAAKDLLLAIPFSASSTDDVPSDTDTPTTPTIASDEQDEHEPVSNDADSLSNLTTDTPPAFNLTEYTTEIIALASAAKIELGVQNIIDARVPVDAARACFLAISDAMTANLNAAHGEVDALPQTSPLNITDVYETRRKSAARSNFKGV